jgi:hypothetical protein
MGTVGYFCILYLSERATTMPNVYTLELLMIAGNHSETRIAVELYATPCDVACDDATALSDCWEDAQTSEAGRTTLRKNTRP